MCFTPFNQKRKDTFMPGFWITMVVCALLWLPFAIDGYKAIHE